MSLREDSGTVVIGLPGRREPVRFQEIIAGALAEQERKERSAKRNAWIVGLVTFGILIAGAIKLFS